MTENTLKSRVFVGLYGDTGHQLHAELLDGKYPHAELRAAAAFSEVVLTELKQRGVRIYQDLAELLSDRKIDLVIFCSPYKDLQGEQIIRALQAGKHVFAEKPCCLSESVLDRIVETARRSGRRFHEMNSSTFAQPYLAMRNLVADGVIGSVIQVLSQKSYPWMDWRPADERVDGGLLRQVGIYNLRFAEQVAGLKIVSLSIEETQLGLPQAASECRMAVSMQMRFEGGAIGSAIANYACPVPDDWGRWGYETLRIFGTKGFVESIDHGRTAQLVLHGKRPEPLDCAAPGEDYFAWFLDEILSGEDRIPFSLETELSPTRWVIRAKALWR